MTITVTLGDCVEILRARTSPLFDACVTDPPYHLTSIVERFGKPGAAEAQFGTDGAFARASRGFMGKEWDGGDVAFRPETWRAVFDQLKPGAHLVAFSGTRTYHRMACAIEDAGFEIRDQLAWVYGSGFPKSHDVSRAIDKAAGAERHITRIVNRSGKAAGTYGAFAGPSPATEPATEPATRWAGWGTALKPAWEPICLARKPLVGTVAANVLAHGTGGLNIDACRVGSGPDVNDRAAKAGSQISGYSGGWSERAGRPYSASLGRWPANLMHDGSDEVMAEFSVTTSGMMKGGTARAAQDHPGSICYGTYGGDAAAADTYDERSAARFFYSAKAGPLDRLGTEHPTVKPVDVMRWLVRLVAPRGSLILDPFAGSGTTGIAALAEGVHAELIDIEPDHVADIQTKLAHLRGEGARIMERHLKRKSVRANPQDGGLFGAAA